VLLPSTARFCCLALLNAVVLQLALLRIRLSNTIQTANDRWALSYFTCWHDVYLYSGCEQK
jgi:hypothetical protein